MTAKQKGKLNEKRVLEAIKKAPVKEGYHVISFAEIARKFGIRGCVVNATVKRLERKNIIEVK